MSSQFGNESEHDVSVEETVRPPKRYKVLLHNDHYTTMEFVIRVLMQIFNKTQNEATQIMLAVHEQGVGVCGVYPAEIAEVKVDSVHKLARNEGYPLRSSMEEV